MSQTLYGLFSERTGIVRRQYRLDKMDWSVVAQPADCALAAPGVYPSCPLAPVVRIAAAIAGITYNARCYCVKFEIDNTDQTVGFSACAVIRARLQASAKTLQEAAVIYKRLNGRYPWSDGIKADEWLANVATQLGEAEQVCPHYFRDNH